MALMDPAEVERRIEDMPGWEVESDALRREFEFDDYMSGIGFVNGLAEVAEEMDHHPDLEVGYARVVVWISTHSEGGITEKDFDLAAAADAV